jgi:hypothetical protein
MNYLKLSDKDELIEALDELRQAIYDTIVAFAPEGTKLSSVDQGTALLIGRAEVFVLIRNVLEMIPNNSIEEKRLKDKYGDISIRDLICIEIQELEKMKKRKLKKLEELKGIKVGNESIIH